jgi:NADPH-dependent 2,4-dienoyl-CoA reductase/sulfur reductase-like enzyme/rhodanese-related sulfurtransferase
MPKTIVVIGGAASGPVAAARARGFDEEARIILVERNPHVSWVQADLRYHLEGRVVDLDKMDAERAAFFEKRHRIEVRTGTEAVGIDVDSRRVVVRDADGTGRIGFDAAIFSGGASTRWSRVPGLDGPGPGVAGFRKLDDLATIREAIARGGKRAVVLGGGRNGFEAACGLVAAGLEVDVIEKAGRPVPRLSLPAARAALGVAEGMGIRLRVGDDAELCEDLGEGRRRLTLKSGEVLETDLVVVAIGLSPSTRILAEAGASLNPDGSVRVDAHMATTLPNVYACGTAVSLPHAVTRSHHWMPHADIGHRTAQIAGRSAAVEEGEFKEAMHPVAGTEILEVGEHRFGRTGLSDAEARSHLGDERVQVSTVHSWSSEAWLKGDEADRHMCVRLIVDREADQVVGGEAWGTQGVPRRIDLLAAAVLEKWSPARLASLDVAYTPAIGPALDPLHAAGTVSALVLRGEAWLMDAERLALAVARDEDLTLLDVGRGDRGDLDVWPAGTQHIPLEELRERLHELPRDKTTVLLSHTGRRGHLAARLLKQSGFDEVYNLDGGAMSWKLTLDR